MRGLLGSKPKEKHEYFNLSDYPVDILSIDNIFLECDIAQDMTFKGGRSGIIHNWTLTVELVIDMW